MIGCLNSDSRLINATVSALSLAYDYDGESVGSLSYSLAQGATKSFSYQYDENGNIVSEQVTVDGVSADITAYEYDADNQLVSAENSSTKWTYSYDNRGNLTAENEYSVSLNESGEKVYTPKENGADSYTYDTNWKDKLTSYNGQTISYDESGNPTSYLGHSLSWTMGRQLASYDNTTYTYNESGIRTSKTVGENTTEFYLNGTNVIYQTDGTNDIYFFYDRNNELVGFKYSGNNYFYVKNQMGDITDIADENGIIVASYSYDPWGSVLSVTGSDTAIANLNPFRYRSYYYDSDIQMYYLQSRYYDPEVGRFINCDDVNYIGLTESEISYNPFAYCENCPVNNSDFDGCISINKIKSFLSSLVIKLRDRLINEIKSSVSYVNGVLKVSTWLIATAIDTIVCAVTTGIVYKSVTKLLKSMIENYRKKAPEKIVDLYENIANFLSVHKVLQKIIIFASKYLTKKAVRKIKNQDSTFTTIAKSLLSNILCSRFTLLSRISSICSAFSSIGGFIAFILDRADGAWDDYMKINVKGLFKRYV